MNELLPCPFCGGEAVVDEKPAYGYEPAVSFEVRCSKCGQRRVGGYFDTVYKSEKWARRKAIEVWNKRSNPWHTGTPTEEGFWLVKYRCVVEGKYNGRLTYRAVKIEKDKIDGFPYESGSIGHDDVWEPIEYQKIDDLWNGEGTNGSDN